MYIAFIRGYAKFHKLLNYLITRSLDFSLLVGVFQTKKENAFSLFCESPTDQGRKQRTGMQKTGWRWGETSDYRFRF
jgi:hypothetical protein